MVERARLITLRSLDRYQLSLYGFLIYFPPLFFEIQIGAYENPCMLKFYFFPLIFSTSVRMNWSKGGGYLRWLSRTLAECTASRSMIYEENYHRRRNLISFYHHLLISNLQIGCGFFIIRPFLAQMEVRIPKGGLWLSWTSSRSWSIKLGERI